VHAGSEAQVRVRAAADVELVRPAEDLWVMRGRAEQCGDLRAGRDRVPVDGDVAQRGALEQL
jgi:hypothetical protein